MEAGEGHEGNACRHAGRRGRQGGQGHHNLREGLGFAAQAASHLALEPQIENPLAIGLLFEQVNIELSTVFNDSLSE